MKRFSSIENAISNLKKERMVIVIDNPDRENQADIIFPAQSVTREKISFLLNECRGLICVALTAEHALRLNLPLMIPPIDNTEKTNVQFTVSVDAKNVKSFGISAVDRAKTIRLLADPSTKPEDFVKPGHVFPLLARDGGVIERPGHTESSIELCRLSGFRSSAVLCELLNEKGEVANLSQISEFSKNFKIPIVSIYDLIQYLKEKTSKRVNEKTLFKTASSLLPTKNGIFKMAVYKSIIDNREHTALILGEISNETPILTRIHSQCLTGDTFLSLKCDCHDQLIKSMKIIQKKGRGAILYLNQEGRGIGLSNKIRAYQFQENGLDTVDANHALNLPADARNYRIAAEILKDLGIRSIQILTNNKEKITQLKNYGINIDKQIALEIPANNINRNYLKTKKYKLGHLLTKI